MTSRSRTVWINAGMWPMYLGYCPDEQSLKIDLRKLRIVGAESVGYCKPRGGVCHILQNDVAEQVFIVCIDQNDNDDLTVAGLVFHEVVHVWQHLTRNIGEEKPGDECQAYFVQHFGIEILRAIRQSNERRREKTGVKK